MTALDDLDAFRHTRHAHGALTADVGPSTPAGYSVTVACPWGVVFDHGVTDAEAHPQHLVAGMAGTGKLRAGLLLPSPASPPGALAQFT